MTQPQLYTANQSKRMRAMNVLDRPTVVFAETIPLIRKRLGQTLDVHLVVQNMSSVPAQAELRLLAPNTGLLATGPRVSLAPGQKGLLVVRWKVFIANSMDLNARNEMFALVVRTRPNGVWDGLEQIPFSLYVRK